MQAISISSRTGTTGTTGTGSDTLMAVVKSLPEDAVASTYRVQIVSLPPAVQTVAGRECAVVSAL